MSDKVDYLGKAKIELNIAGDDWDDGHKRSANQRTNTAIACALIALVERLDAMTMPDESEQKMALLVNTGDYVQHVRVVE